MFIKVMFGAGCSVLVNTSCRLVNLTAHLRQKAGLPPDATIALLAEDGNLVSLEEDLKEGASRAQTMGNSLLKERTIYVLVRIISKRERTWPPPAMSPYWKTWMTITQSWQRNCAGCQASPLRATTGGSAWALGEAAMSKAPLQGPERALIKGKDCTLY
uniref:Chromosome 22 open reading frame 15 n=1 Tax=Gorilla gorilla gorilla TaxID=9595 RepID=G3R108_GORGO